jgi:ribosome biogenesis GTPase / thiamine phosphate phosphatase
MTLENEDRLRSIGLTPPLLQRYAQLQAEGQVDGHKMRVVEVHRDTVVLHDGDREIDARVRPAVLKTAEIGGDPLTVGDWVLAEQLRDKSWWLIALVPPLTRLARRNSEGRRQCLVSNVDSALLMMGLDGNHNVRRLERYLAMVQGAGVWPIVVLSKRDVAPHAQQRVDDVRSRVPAEVPVHAIDARSAAVCAEFAPYLGPGQTVVLLGSSGVGKSTLTNALMGHTVQATAEVRADDSRGRHTTTVRSLHRLPGGACLIDTPGLRGLQADTNEEGLNVSFSDIVALAGQCHFRDCTHRHEPDCAVRDQLNPDRLANYRKLMREVQRESMTFLDRRKQLAEWKARGRAAEQRMKLKRG